VHDEDIREKIDPDKKYIFSAPRYFERIAASMFDVLPTAELGRTRDCIQLTEPGEKGVIALITPEAVEIRLPTVEWSTPYSPVSSSCLLERIEMSGLSEQDLAQLVADARRKRQSEFVPCHHCGKPTPPEHRHTLDGKEVCHGFSEREEGVVH